VVVDADGAEARGECASRSGEEEAGEKEGQSPGVACVKCERKGGDDGMPERGQVDRIHGGAR